MMLDFNTLAQACAPEVAPTTMAAIVRTESSFNPYAIGVVRGHLVRQPRNLGEAVATVHALELAGYDYSVGLAQINRAHFDAYGLMPEAALEPCRNLAAGADILSRCFERARAISSGPQQALGASLSCYASGNFVTGYRVGYVQRVGANAMTRALPRIPTIDPAGTPIPVVPNAPDVSNHRRPDHDKVDRNHDPPAAPETPDADDARVF
ncbi:lytic transglycosylase domain-containing protein [Caballeronia sp. KNU42]